MKFKSKVYRIGNGVCVYMPKVVSDELDLTVGDICKIQIVEDERKGDKENSILVVFE